SVYFTSLYGSDTGLSFATWMAIGVPVALITTLLAWIWLQVLFAADFKYYDHQRGSLSKQQN
ncbi:putative I'M NOT DEAD yet protein, partial [Daphnia magna]